MTALALHLPDPNAQSLEAMSTDQLREALVDCFRVTETALRSAAVYVRELERRGEDLSDLKLSMMTHLRKIAYGQVIPELVVRFYGRPQMLDVVSSLPIPDQEKLAAGEPVKVMVSGPNGETTHKMMDPLKMRPEHVRQVFGRNCIRDEAEQVAFLDAKRQKDQYRVPDRVGELRIDKERGGVMVGKKFIPLADLAAAVRILQK